MRLVLIAASTAAGLAACAPVPPAAPYGYAPAQATSYGYYGGGYAAPGPYYAEPGYAPYPGPYVAPGPAIVVEGGRRWDRERYYDRPGYRGGPGPGPGYHSPGPGPQAFNRGPAPGNFGGGRPAPAPVAAARPGPAAVVPPPPAGGPAFEQWNRANVNAAPTQNDLGSSNR